MKQVKYAVNKLFISAIRSRGNIYRMYVVTAPRGHCNCMVPHKSFSIINRV